MSLFLGQTTGGFDASRLQQSDGRVMVKTYQWDYTGSGAQVKPWADGMLWSRTRLGCSDSDGILLGNDFQCTGRWDNDQQDVLGGSQSKKVIGTTKDASGNPLGSCIVQAFATVDDTFLGQTVSDTAGYYVLPVFYTAAIYLVAYKAGGSDVAGTSVNTIIPV